MFAWGPARPAPGRAGDAGLQQRGGARAELAHGPRGRGVAQAGPGAVVLQRAQLLLQQLRAADVGDHHLRARRRARPLVSGAPLHAAAHLSLGRDSGNAAAEPALPPATQPAL